MGRKKIDVSGQRFGKVKVIGPHGLEKGHFFWKCICDCGKEFLCRGSHLKSGAIISCGCYRAAQSRKRNRKHGECVGQKVSSLYSSWSAMIERCTNPKCSSFHNYGGRGITICDEWFDFLAFKKWAENAGYQKNLTIERIDVNGNYEPNNCTWITKVDQCKNKRKTIRLNVDGKIMVLSDFARLLGIAHGTVWNWWKKYGPEKAITIAREFAHARQC